MFSGYICTSDRCHYVLRFWSEKLYFEVCFTLVYNNVCDKYYNSISLLCVLIELSKTLAIAYRLIYF